MAGEFGSGGDAQDAVAAQFGFDTAMEPPTRRTRQGQVHTAVDLQHEIALAHDLHLAIGGDLHPTARLQGGLERRKVLAGEVFAVEGDVGHAVGHAQKLPVRASIEDPEHENQSRGQRKRDAVARPVAGAGDRDHCRAVARLVEAAAHELLPQTGAEGGIGLGRRDGAHRIARRLLRRVEFDVVSVVACTHPSVSLRISPSALKAREYRFRIAA